MLPLPLVEYHLGEKNHLPLGFQVAKIQLAIITLSLAGFLYEPPAEQHGHTTTQKALNVVGTCYTAIFMCYVATDIFIKAHIGKQYVPDELAEIIKPALSLNEYVRQNIIIGFFAFLSAIPYATTAIAYPFDPLALFIPYLFYIFVATTLLHVLPVKLTLEHPLYGAPPRWAQSFWQMITCHSMSPEEQTAIISKAKSDAQRYQLLGQIQNAKEHFLASLVPSLGEVNEDKLYEYMNKSHQEKLSYLLSFQKAVPQLPQSLTYIARFLGIVIELGASLGYAANPVLVIHHWLKNWWLTAFLTAPSLYLFGVLTAFFGDMFGLRILTDIGLWGKDVLKLPIEFRAYPKVMLCAITINIFCMVFAAAAAQEMMENAFADKVTPEVLATLTTLAQIGISILAWYGPQDFQKLIIRYIAQYTQTNAHGKLMELVSRFEALENDILRLRDVEKISSDHRTEKLIAECDVETPEEKATSCADWCYFPWQKQAKNANQLTTALLK